MPCALPSDVYHLKTDPNTDSQQSWHSGTVAQHRPAYLRELVEALTRRGVYLELPNSRGSMNTSPFILRRLIFTLSRSSQAFVCPAAPWCHADDAPPCLCSSVSPYCLDLTAFVTLPEPKLDLSVAGTLPEGSVLALALEVVLARRCSSSLLEAETDGRHSQTLSPLTHIDWLQWPTRRSVGF